MPERSQQLWRVLKVAVGMEYTNPSRALKIVDMVMNQVDSYYGSPSTWHDMSVLAGRVGHRQGRLALVQAGIRQWPLDVRLLCEEARMLVSFEEGCDHELGREKWQRLLAMEQSLTGFEWRFWVYGAEYKATFLGRTREGLKMLDQGVLKVKRKYLMNVFRAYRTILLDSIPGRELKTKAEMRNYQKWAGRVLEERFKVGLDLGVEYGYVLALDLAKLYQKKAASADEKEQEKLNKALYFLDLAESLFSGNRNYQIWEIYVTKARVLMALRRYGDALKIFKSLPSSERFRPSNANMLRLAALMTGEEFGDQKKYEESSDEPAWPEAGEGLFDNNGAGLLQLARGSKDMENILLKVAAELVSAEKGGES